MNSVRNVEIYDDPKCALLINSPRSLEACLRVGLDPRDLLPVKLSKADQKLPPHLLKLKVDSKEKIRKANISDVRAERQKMLRSNNELRARQRPTSPSSLTQDSVGFQNDKLEMDNRRLEKSRARQQKDMLRMIENEQNLMLTQKKLEEVEKNAREKRKEHDAEVKKKKDELLAKNLKWEQQKQEKERERLQTMKMIGARYAKEQAETQRREQERDEAQKLRMIESDRHSAERFNARQNTIEQLAKAKEDALNQSRLAMEDREMRLTQRAAEKAEEYKKVVESRRLQAAKRIQSSQEAKQQLCAETMRRYNEKSEAHRKKIEERETEEAENLEKTKEANKAKDAERRQRLQDAKFVLEDKRANTKGKIEKKAMTFTRQVEERERKAEERRMKTQIYEEEKHQAVLRLRRQDEFKRLQILRGLDNHSTRGEKIAEHKDWVTRQQKQARQEAFMRNHKISEASNEMRVTNKFKNLDDFISVGSGSRTDMNDDHNASQLDLLN